MSPSSTRRFPRVTVRSLACAALALGVALAAGRALAGEVGGSFTVGATVVRSAAVRVVTRPEGRAIQIDARVELGGRSGGVQIAAHGDVGHFTTGEASLSAAVDAGAARVLFVTVLPDGRPPAIRLRD